VGFLVRQGQVVHALKRVRVIEAQLGFSLFQSLFEKRQGDVVIASRQT
jgi:hypothetical protein